MAATDTIAGLGEVGQACGLPHQVRARHAVPVLMPLNFITRHEMVSANERLNLTSNLK